MNLPRRIGLVENAGLQIPAISPDGRQLLYLRSDEAQLSPMTLVGADTPPEGSLSIWLRPVTGASPGKRLRYNRKLWIGG